jgi:hypothetical protein
LNLIRNQDQEITFRAPGIRVCVVLDGLTADVLLFLEEQVLQLSAMATILLSNPNELLANRGQANRGLSKHDDDRAADIQHTWYSH